jgi:hypothetical protein
MLDHNGIRTGGEREMAPNRQTLIKPNVAYGSITVLTARKRDFRSTPNNGHRDVGRVGPLRARTRHHRPLHSITLSARASNVGDRMRPSALAVLRLITNSNFVGCSTGKSAGFAPFSILATKTAERRKLSTMSVP